MTARRPLPTIAKCPGIACNAHEKQPCSDVCLSPFTLRYFVNCRCGWRGPGRASERAAILAWNRRSDAEAERRGALACLDYVAKNTCISGYTKRMIAEAIKRGEVLPAKAKKGARKS